MNDKKRILGDLRIFQSVFNDLKMKHELIGLSDGTHKWVYTYDGADPYSLEDDSFPLTTKLIRQRTARAELFGLTYAKQEILRENEADAIFNINSRIKALKDLEPPKGEMK